MSKRTEDAIVFRCGDAQLVGILHRGLSDAKHGVVIVVGGPQYRVGSHRQFVILARALARSGLPVLRFDYRGMGDSDGAFGGFERVSDDICVAVDLLMKQCPELNSVALVGLCDGASAALMYGVTDPRITQLVLVNPWVRTEGTYAATNLRHYYWRRFVQKSFWRKVFSGQFQIRRSVSGIAQNVRQANQGAETGSFVERMRAALQRFNGDVCVLLSGRDLTAQEFSDVCARDATWRAAMQRSRVVRIDLPGADHTFSKAVAHNDFIARVVEFLNDTRASNSVRSSPAQPPGERRVVA